VEFPFGSKKLSLFSPEDVEKYRKELNIQEHNDDTVKDDFFAQRIGKILKMKYIGLKLQYFLPMK